MNSVSVQKSDMTLLKFLMLCGRFY